MSRGSRSILSLAFLATAGCLSSGSGYNLEWVVRIGGKPATLASGAPVAVRVMLDMGGAPPFFRKGSLAGLRCVSQVAK